jgi:hypothetical protein
MAEKGTGPICRNGPEGAPHKLDLSPFPRPKIFTINAWNEWTEGSYLEPDTVHKLGYLEALREVFGRGN